MRERQGGFIGVRRALLSANKSRILFNLPLTDSGAGAVNTAPTTAKGGATATFTRATVAWTKLSTGLWAQVNSGVARSCYLGADTTVGAYGGYFAEGAGTQLVTPTASIRDMTDASWVKTTMTVTKAAVGIDGVTNSASRLAATGATATVLQTLTAAASSRTYSAFIRRVSGTGTVKLVQGATKTADLATSINASTYTLCQLNASVLNSAFGVELGTSGDVVEVDFNQFEAAAFASSPMASAGAARNADVLTYVASGNIIATVGSAYAEAQRIAASGNGTLVGVNAGNGILFSNNVVTVLSDGTNTPNVSTTVTSAYKAAGAWSAAGMNISVNGSAVASSAFDGDIGVTTTLSVGDSLYGYVKNIRIYNRALSAAQLQAMTT